VHKKYHGNDDGDDGDLFSGKGQQQSSGAEADPAQSHVVLGA